MKYKAIAAVMLANLVFVSADFGQGGGTATPAEPDDNKTETKQAAPQKTCPVMGKDIDKALYTDVMGYRVFVCCKGCLAPIEADPEKYLKIIRAKGETPQPTPKPVCGKCGKLKGTPDCCAKNAKLCECGLVKGSPGCCKVKN